MTETSNLAVCRQLAQLAVNIVDYIDDDNYMTPFNWNGSEWLFGTEVPRVVLNEAYVDYSTSGTSATVNVWAELYNTFSSDTSTNTSSGDPTRQDDGTIRLDGAYQLVISADTSTTLRSATNLRGDPATPVYSTVTVPSNTTAQPQGYCVIGPPNVTTAGDPTPTVASNQMTYNATVTAGTTPPAPTLLLRRLACPALPAQTDPTQANYNPWVTVDYMESIPVNNSTATTRQSYGRPQPYAGLSTNSSGLSLLVPQNPNSSSTVHHTLGQVNNPVTSPFNWLVHLDRQLISPMELLHVSCFKPHELTQQFSTNANGQTTYFNHVAPWFGQALPGTTPNALSSLSLYRAFETLETHSRSAGVNFTDARIPGLININTIWHVEKRSGAAAMRTCPMVSMGPNTPIPWWTNYMLSYMPGEHLLVHPVRVIGLIMACATSCRAIPPTALRTHSCGPDSPRSRSHSRQPSRLR